MDSAFAQVRRANRNLFFGSLLGSGMVTAIGACLVLFGQWIIGVVLIGSGIAVASLLFMTLYLPEYLFIRRVIALGLVDAFDDLHELFEMIKKHRSNDASLSTLLQYCQKFPQLIPEEIV